MITLQKLKEFENYKGLYDGFYLQKIKTETNINSEEDWNLISSFIPDIYVINTNIASKTYKERILGNLNKICDAKQTVDYFLYLGNSLYG